jgi:DnaJ-domain-containing protein 1
MSGAEWLALIGGVAVGFCIVYIMLSAGAKPKRQTQARSRFGQQQWQQQQQQQQPRSDQQQQYRQQYRPEPTIADRWFLILDVPQGASREEVERAYKVKISQYHPDKVAQMGIEIRELAEAKSKEINAAYDFATRSDSRVV